MSWTCLHREEERVYKDYRGHVLWHRRVGEVLNPNYRSVGEVATLKRELSPEIFMRSVSSGPDLVAAACAPSTG